jgi:ribonuclease HII
MQIQKFNITDLEFIGVDEVGRGSFIGPVITCAVYINQADLTKLETIPYTINDSKKLSKKTRKQIVNWINTNNISYKIGSASVQEIDELNIREANNLAMNRAIYNLFLSKYSENKFNNNSNSNITTNKKINCYIDGNYFNDVYHLCNYSTDFLTYLELIKPNFKTIIKGDASNIAIALASIIAKEYRDDLITNLANNKQHHAYLWHKNMGYGTKEHRQAILTNGITIHHRLSFLSKLIY